jgi:predicted nucleic acid-binding protein
MNYLVDTNILTRLVEPSHAMHQQAHDAVSLLIRQANTLSVISQNLYEFWVVATRPTNVNGLGKTASEALANLIYFEGLFHWLDETKPIYGVWKHLVTSTPIIRKNAHDARFVAAMSVHGLTHLLTFNTQDFRQYPGITAVTPAEVLIPAPPTSGANPP